MRAAGACPMYCGRCSQSSSRTGSASFCTSCFGKSCRAPAHRAGLGVARVSLTVRTAALRWLEPARSVNVRLKNRGRTVPTVEWSSEVGSTKVEGWPPEEPGASGETTREETVSNPSIAGDWAFTKYRKVDIARIFNFLRLAVPGP